MVILTLNLINAKNLTIAKEVVEKCIPNIVPRQ